MEILYHSAITANAVQWPIIISVTENYTYTSRLIPQFVNRDSIETMLIVWIAYLYSLVVRIVLRIYTVWFCALLCLFVQFGSVYCFPYLYSLVHLDSCCLFCGIGVELVSNYCCTVLDWWCWVGAELALGSYSTGIGFVQIWVRRYSGTWSWSYVADT